MINPFRHLNSVRRILGIALLTAWVFLAGSADALITESELKARIEKAAEGFKDISMVGTVTYKNRKAIAKIESNYARLYEFKSANIYFKDPDKLRMDGKLGMVRFEYIVNGWSKIVRAPTIRLVKREDFTGDPAKLQDAFDLGIITPALWRNRRIEVIEDPEATSNSEIKVRLHWPKGDMMLLAWLDSKDLFLKRFEKRTGDGKLQFRAIYLNPKKVGGLIWMPTTVEIYTSDGEKAGASEYTDIKVNTGLSDSLFE
ncbi:MAG: hypothetical protein N3B12_07700 [Armatimonadetes bacterium]|nr:hypothetical protein [Armatimonadota bacterium]